jgi:hypothetical protein
VGAVLAKQPTQWNDYLLNTTAFLVISRLQYLQMRVRRAMSSSKTGGIINGGGYAGESVVLCCAVLLRSLDLRGIGRI